MFRCSVAHVFAAFGNDSAVSWLAPHLQSNISACPPWIGGALRVPKKDPRNGTLYQRHQDHERPVRAPAAGHLLCREAAGEGASENGREGDRQATQAGLPDPSR